MLLYDLSGPPGNVATIAGGPGDQDSPDVFGTVVAFRSPLGITITNWAMDMTLRAPTDGPGVSRPSVGANVAAWETGAPGSRDVVVSRIPGDEYVLGAASAAAHVPGDQHAPSAWGRYVAYVDEADAGAVWLHDSDPSTRSSARLCPGAATGVALGEYQSHLVAAVVRIADGYDADVAVWDDAMHEIAALHVAGEQRNPHISGDWVAFEDLSTGRSQVVLWHWTTGVVFVPHPSASEQALNDLYVAQDAEVRVVFADDAHGDFDIALYQLAIPAGTPDGGAVSDWPPRPPPPPPPPQPPAASCTDLGAATILATLELARDGQRPEAGNQAFAVPAAPGGITPILVCVEADRVSAAWITVDDEAVAKPSDFEPSVTRLEIPYAVKGATSTVAGVIAGKPGARLVVRVLADPARLDPGAATVSAAPRAAVATSGCGSAGSAGLASLAALALFLRRRARPVV